MPSGSDSDCSPDQSCYGLEVCKNYFYGDTLDDASQCNDNNVCPSISGSDSDSYSDCSLGIMIWTWSLLKITFVVLH